MPLLYSSIQPTSILNDVPDTARGWGGWAFDPGEVAYISGPPGLEADAPAQPSCCRYQGPWKSCSGSGAFKLVQI